MKKVLVFLAVAFLFSLAPSAHAQTRNREFQVTAGIGGAWKSPARFDLDLNGEYFWNDTYSLGLDVDIFAGGFTAYDFIGFGRYHFELAKYPKFSPYVGVGLGALINSRGRGWFDLMLPEAGFLYELTPHFYLGPNASLHILAGANTTWDFQTVGQVTYRF